MAIYKSNGASAPLAVMIQTIAQTMNEKGAEFASPELAGAVASVEGLTNSHLDAAEMEYQETNHVTAIKEAVDTASFELPQQFSEASLEAASLVSMASADLETFDQSALFSGLVGSVEMENTGGQDFRLTPSIEAFHASTSKDAAPYSIAYNLFATEQTEFEKLFFPLKTLSAEDLSFSVSVGFNEIHKEQYHSSTGEVIGFDKIPLHKATQDHTILENNALDLIPVHSTDSTAKFVDTAVLPTKTVVSNGFDVTTSALKIGEDIGYLGLCQDAGVLGGQQFTSEDDIDPRIALSTLVLSITDGTDTDTVIVPVENLPRAGFYRGIEGDPLEYALSFKNRSVTLSSDTLAVDGAAPASLAQLSAANMSLRITLAVNGEINIETGELAVNGNKVSIDSAYDVAGMELSKDAAPAKPIVDLLAVSIIGYTIKATRSNVNSRTRGFLVGGKKHVERHIVYPRSPITAVAPVGDAKTDAADLTTLINTTKTIMTGDAVTKLFEIDASLKRHQVAVLQNGAIPEVEGVGRLVLNKPHYEEIDLDVSTIINSGRTFEKAADIKAAFVNTIRDAIHRMFRETGYVGALRSRQGGSTAQPEIIGVTDQYIKQFLMIDGDADTFGRDLKHTLSDVEDLRMLDTAFFSVRIPNADPCDPLTFGGCAWAPQITRTLQTQRDNSNVRETTVQPRYRQVNNLPMLIRVNISGLSKALREKTKAPVRDV